MGIETVERHPQEILADFQAELSDKVKDVGDSLRSLAVVMIGEGYSPQAAAALITGYLSGQIGTLLDYSLQDSLKDDRDKMVAVAAARADDTPAARGAN